MNTRTKHLIVAVALLMAPTRGFAQELEPYDGQDAVDRLTENNGRLVDAVSALYADIANEFNALQAHYASCTQKTGNEQSVCLAHYDQTLAGALNKAKSRKPEVMRELDAGVKTAVSEKDDYFEAEGNTEAFVKALLEQNPDDAGAMVAEQALDAQDLRDYTASFFAEVTRKLYELQKARMQRIMIAVSDIQVPDVPDTEEAKARVDKGRKERWKKLAERIGGRTAESGGSRSDSLPPLLPTRK